MASYALLPNLKKRSVFCHRRRIEKFCPFFYTVAPKCFCIRRLAVLYQTPGWRPPRITGRFVNTVTKGGSEPLTITPRSDFMAKSLFWSIDVCRGLGILPLRLNIWLEFFLRPILAQDLPRNYFFRFFFVQFFYKLFRKFVLIASCTEIFRRVSLNFVFF